jgi:transcriptional regulator with XRE-family HTH domain
MQALIDYMRISGLNQGELAKRIGVDPTHLNHWIHRRRAPTIANLKLISEKTGISLERLARDL